MTIGPLNILRKLTENIFKQKVPKIKTMFDREFITTVVIADMFTLTYFFVCLPCTIEFSYTSLPILLYLFRIWFYQDF